MLATLDGEPLSASHVVHGSFRRICDRAGIPYGTRARKGLRFHDLRHSAATLLLAQGIPQRVVMEILGHTRQSTTERYMHVAAGLRAILQGQWTARSDLKELRAAPHSGRGKKEVRRVSNDLENDANFAYNSYVATSRYSIGKDAAKSIDLAYGNYVIADTLAAGARLAVFAPSEDRDDAYAIRLVADSMSVAVMLLTEAALAIDGVRSDDADFAFAAGCVLCRRTTKTEERPRSSEGAVTTSTSLSTGGRRSSGLQARRSGAGTTTCWPASRQCSKPR